MIPLHRAQAWLLAALVLCVAPSASRADDAQHTARARLPDTRPERVPIRAFGIVTDDLGRAIPHARVVISNELYVTAQPPVEADPVPVTADTGLDGAFTATDIPPGMVRAFADDSDGNAYVHVYAGPRYPVFHAILPMRRAQNDLGTIRLVRLHASDIAWLAGLNHDREENGVAPVVFDEYLMEGARHWSRYMRTHALFSHECRFRAVSCRSASDYESTLPGSLGDAAENIAYGYTDWRSAQDAFMAERVVCRVSANERCAWSHEVGHYLNIVSPIVRFVGVAVSGLYYDEEFQGGF